MVAIGTAFGQVGVRWGLKACVSWTKVDTTLTGLRLYRQLSTESPTASASRALLASSPLRKVLVANRGEIACRVIATARKLGLGTVAVYSEADKGAQHVQMADEAYCIGKAAVRDSYLRADAVMHVARMAGAQAVHPGYGFLSENAAFADACAQAGLIFVGPPGAAIRAMGDKAQAKAVMSAAGVPVVPGYHGEDQSDESLLRLAKDIGFPLLVKAVSGGGGKGMKLAHSMQELSDAIASARREAAASFGDDRLLLERYVTRPRHVEVQVVADSHGNAVYLFDRDCSVQRRHQKIIEEAPAPFLPGEFHAMIGEAAVRAAKAVGYRNAGTVEFIVDMDSTSPAAGSSAAPAFYFMEMNTRLQVEHPVSEAVAGVDLVEWQLVVAAGGQLPLSQQQVFFGEQVGGAGPRGHSFEARLYAESPRNQFLPGAGTVHRWRPPAESLAFEQLFLSSSETTTSTTSTTKATDKATSGGSTAVAVPSQLPANTYVRVDSGVREGDQVGTFYDPMIAKVITWGPDRDTALAALRYALAHTQVAGLPTNLAYLRRLAAHPAFIAGELDTGFVKRHEAELLAPQAVPPVAVAMASVARHLLQVSAAESQRPAGAWGIPDSKRLWHHMHVKYPDMRSPDALLDSHQAALASAAAASSAGATETAAEAGATGTASPKHTAYPHQHAASGLQVAVTIKTATDFDVEVAGLPQAGMLRDQGAGSEPGFGYTPPHQYHYLPQQEHQKKKRHGEHVVIRGAQLVGNQLVAEANHRRVKAEVSSYSHGDEQVLCLWLDGEQYEFRWPVRKWSKDVRSVEAHADVGGELKAPMPGRVVKMMVKEGDKVARGAALVVIEAMKMEHALAAPRAGIVKAVAVAPGVQVSDGQVLLVVAAEEGGAQQAPTAAAK